MPDGRTVWLETGSDSAGLQHIVDRHQKDFAKRGVSSNEITSLIFNALQHGRVVDTIGSGRNLRPVYEVSFKGSTQRIAVGVGNNGFIITAHPN